MTGTSPASSSRALAWKLSGDLVAAVCASLSVSPVVTAMDRAITRNASGAQKLWPALVEGLIELARRPLTNMVSTPTRWLVLVYSATYAAANSVNSLCAHFDVSPMLPVLVASTAGNMTTGIAKDRAFARMYGVVAPKAMPMRSYGLFFTRDVMAMAFIFTLPPIVAPRIKEAVESGALPMSVKSASLATQLSTPVISQVFTTPLHLLGLSIYNATDAPLSKHLATLRETYPPTVLLRMIRIIPAFSVGGVVNKSLRSEWHACSPV
uniref:Uncharacterized protein n=1 Tax=Haptolina brevifila TaxID=156173 RepID=A0A7S2HQZ1_9EUKA|mmetsp:Transcript_57069/g.113367  ORF Transcript_57069/g.113367 Transcript_57069/m.113367 type:complete len:266 (+) Transcript_57069:114-911(+)